MTGVQPTEPRIAAFLCIHGLCERWTLWFGQEYLWFLTGSNLATLFYGDHLAGLFCEELKLDVRKSEGEKKGEM